MASVDPLDLRRYVAFRLKEERREHTFDALVKRMGISKTQIVDLVNDHPGKGVGPKVVAGAANTWFKGSVDALNKAAGDWARENPAVAERVTEYIERYENRAAAIATGGNWLPGAVEQLRSMQLDADEDPPIAWWLGRLRAYDAALRTADAIHQQAEGGDPLADLDLPRRPRKRP